jgi:uncharacterized protein (TIGR00255 family)
MIRSMTAFASCNLQQSWGHLYWEIRSVNHRYLDASFRLNENLRDLEPECRNMLRNKIQRGKIECYLRYQSNNVIDTDLNLNQSLLQRLLALADAITEKEPGIKSISVADILRWPGVIEMPEADIDSVKQMAKKLFQDAVTELLVVREREGLALQKLIVERLHHIHELVKTIKARMATVNPTLKTKLLERLTQFKVEIDPIRLEQELVLLVQKADITEEVDRLQTHVAEAFRIVEAGGAIGRRCDFLLQEFNREANTISSKTGDIEITQAVLDMKVFIEQIREQIQNLE